MNQSIDQSSLSWTAYYEQNLAYLKDGALRGPPDPS